MTGVQTCALPIYNMIKLFYSEVVKTKMGNMPNEEYELRNGFQELHNVTLKVDSVILKGIKLLMAVFILYVAFNTRIFIGVGVLLIEGIYIFYKKNYEKKVKIAIENVKNNMEISKEQLINEDGKKGINLLITLLVISIFTGFNYIIAISFILVFLYTAKNLYIAYKE